MTLQNGLPLQKRQKTSESTEVKVTGSEDRKCGTEHSGKRLSMNVICQECGLNMTSMDEVRKN